MVNQQRGAGGRRDQLEGHNHYLHCCCCQDKIPNKSNVREKGLAHSLRVQAVVMGKMWYRSREQLLTLSSLSAAEMNSGAQLAFFFSFRLRSPVDVTVLAIFNFPTSVNPIILHRNIQRFVSYIVLNPIKLIININNREMVKQLRVNGSELEHPNNKAVSSQSNCTLPMKQAAGSK